MSKVCFNGDNPFEPNRVPKAPDPFGLAHEQLNNSEPVRIVGQSEAVAKLDGVFRRFSWLERSTSHAAVVVGPAGCGKSSVIEECASAASKPLVRIGLNEVGAIDELQALAVHRVHALGLDPQHCCKVAVHVVNIESASLSELSELKRLMSFPSIVRTCVQGRSVVMDTSQFLWLAEATLQEETCTAITSLLCPHAIRLKPLGRNELFELLAVSELSPLLRVKSELFEIGVDLDLSELALWQMVDQAMSSNPNLGAHAILSQVAEFEIAIWASITSPGEVAK